MTSARVAATVSDSVRRSCLARLSGRNFLSPTSEARGEKIVEYKPRREEQRSGHGSDLDYSVKDVEASASCFNASCVCVCFFNFDFLLYSTNLLTKIRRPIGEPRGAERTKYCSLNEFKGRDEDRSSDEG